MRSFEKLAAASLFETSNFEMKAKNQDTSERKEQKTLDNLIRQTIGKDSLLSFPRSGENPAQLIHFLHAFEQQSGNKFSKGSTVELGMDSKDFARDHNRVATAFSTETSNIKESLHSNLKETRSFGNSLQNPVEHMSSLKIPEAAVVAIAQAAAKVNGEPEKYLPGWPLLSKVQMLKCEKCSREFVSPLNHRRHIRVHRRLLNLEKRGDTQKKRADLAKFWDKLSADEAKQILSFKNIMLEEVPASSIIKDMTSFIRKPGRPSWPQFYVKAGAALLDVAQMKSSRFPLSAADLFSILDDASEKTFLSAGTALSVQKFVFAGEAGKVILEVRNLVASMGFLVEQKLVEAWLVDKDAEALRFQKLLVDEEEAAEKRRVEQLERKRLKKLRQKELKEKEQAVNVEIVDTATSSPEVETGGSLTAISSSSSILSDDASPRQIPVASSADYYKDATVARESDMSNTDHIGPPDMDLESRASPDSVLGVPVDPELDYANQQGQRKDKFFIDVNFVSSGREQKSSMETDLVLSQKYVSGYKNQQTFLKRTKKSPNASSSWQVSSSNGVLNSDSVSGQRFGNNNKLLAQRNNLGGNVYRIWTKKSHPVSMKSINIGPKTEDRPKDGADVACEVKNVDSCKSSSDFSDSGLTCESTVMAAQEDTDIMAVETSTKAEVNDAQKTPVLNDVSVSSHCTNPEVTDGELLIGSMSLCLDRFPNGVLKPRGVYKKDIVLEESKCSADGKDCNSICNCIDSSTEFLSASSTVGPSDSRVINNSSAISHRACADSLSDRDSLGHPPKQNSQGMFGKHELRQEGISKPGTKIWRPISNATDCKGEEAITYSIMNSVQTKGVMIDSHRRAEISETGHFPLKHENSRHLVCTKNEDRCFADSDSEQNIDNSHNEKQFGETVDRTLRNENKLQLLDDANEGSECFSRKPNGIVEAVDQHETNFGSACDAAAAFLYQRWEAALTSSEAEVLEILDSGAVEGVFTAMSSVGSETGRFVSGIVSENNYLSGASFQSKGGGDGSIESVQGRLKSFDCGFGALTDGSSSSHYSQAVEIMETESKGDFRKPPALKPEIEHLKYMPKQGK